ncbi:MAG: RagB/SusD family nutrient uptake outer membrane protein [Bacteroidetes bacterium]|nr:RagB/SusD family nutrient uptake outer membrane protein [Bacteroidota bacterium]
MIIKLIQPPALFFLIVLPVVLESCNKILNAAPPTIEIGITAAFDDSVSAVAAVTGVYTLTNGNGNFIGGGLSYFPARSADEVIHYGFTDYFALDSLPTDNTDVYYIWLEGFQNLAWINNNINGLRPAKKISTALQHQLLGESLFCRAFVYFYLVNLWGDAIPLITSTDVGATRNAKSVPRQQIYAQIEADLLEAQSLLPITYAGAGRVRPNRMAATALLAKVYLYLDKYSDALIQANTVINSNLYSPLPPASSAFLATSREAIWQLLPPTNQGQLQPVAEAVIYHNSTSGLTPQLLAAFEPGDLRRQYWVADNVYNGSTYTIPAKYRRLGSGIDSLPDEYYVMLRVAEQYLIRAEANARLGQTAAAIADLNVIRVRAGVPVLADTLSQAQCIAAIEHERRVELFAEWGHRWLDLKRWPGIENPAISRADEVLGTVKADWQPTDKYYPVPAAEIILDPNLLQNPGYAGH